MEPTPASELWVDPRVVVRPSAIEGRGLFAERAIRQGTVVISLAGRLVSSAELDRLVAEADADGEAPYVDTITVFEGQHLVLPPGTIVHFGNHSCDPNLWLAGAYEIATSRDVAAAAELTTDYGTSSGVDGFRLTCRCGSVRCRGVVTGEDWRLGDLQHRYDGHWSPALQARIDRDRRA